tara:strand:+ start:94 stop:1116 length:1023 start_codon:yes stop_codon:yes gene_type:complete
MISFSFCSKKNVKKLMRFLGKNWEKNYILSKNLKLIDWQHLSKKNKYNFIIATLNGKIIGCLGFISHSHFSKKLKSNDTLWLVNWMVIKKTSVSGLEFINFITKKINFKRIGSVGGNYTTQTILKKLGFKIGNLNHYFLINPKINNFKLISFPSNLKKISKLELENRKLKLLRKKLHFGIFGKNTNKLVKKFGKDQTYFINRYLNHPYYKYKIYLIYSYNKVLGFFVTRICKFKKRKALRIIDFFGYDKALIKIANPLRKLITSINAEYVDFYEHGINNSIMSKTGLLKNKFDNTTVVPNHFEPFEKKNINLGWALRSTNSFKTRIFKGDCDQDRPSILS